MNSIYNFMTDSAKKIKSISDQMVTDTPPSGQNLNYFGASLSYEYDRLSHSSIQVVQHNLNNEMSRNLRKSVLNLGEFCLELIKHVGNIQKETDNDEPAYSTSVLELRNEISEEVAEVLKILNILKTVSLSSNQNAYRGAGNTIENILNSFKSIKRYSTPIANEEEKDKVYDILREAIGEASILYNALKMVIANIVSSPDECITASLELILASLSSLSNSVKNYVLTSGDDDFRGILKSMEECFLYFLNLLMICEQVDGHIDVQDNKEQFKIACKDVVKSIRLFTTETTKKIQEEK